MKQQPWCPVCRAKTAVKGVYYPPNGFYEVFAEHGCDGDGKRVKDADYGFIQDGVTVPAWDHQRDQGATG